MNNFVHLAGGENASFILRWRGRQEGPYSAIVIEAKLAANEIGLLHEIFYDGKWNTIRQYMLERAALLQAQAEQETQERENAERQAKERQDELQATILAEERRKNDLLAANLTRQNQVIGLPPIPLKSARSGLILTLAIIGLFVCAPLSIAAWIMGHEDLVEMDAGRMDASGRASTSSSRNLGILGTLLWCVGLIIYFVIHFAF